MGLLDHKTAAGGNSGIGLATAKRFLAERPELDTAAHKLGPPRGCPARWRRNTPMIWTGSTPRSAAS